MPMTCWLIVFRRSKLSMCLCLCLCIYDVKLSRDAHRHLMWGTEDWTSAMVVNKANVGPSSAYVQHIYGAVLQRQNRPNYAHVYEPSGKGQG